MDDDPLELYFKEFFDVPFPEPEKPKFTFIDLFAGMGGFRLAMQAQGGKCIFSSEWNQYAQKTYMANFGDMPFGDITKEENKILYPCAFRRALRRIPLPAVLYCRRVQKKQSWP